MLKGILALIGVRLAKLLVQESNAPSFMNLGRKAHSLGTGLPTGVSD